MATLFPCCELSKCIDEASPIENLSAEGLDAPTFIATRWPWTNPNNPIGDDSGPPPVFKSDGCISTCESTVSQEEANLCASRQAVICTGPGGGTFFSDFQAVSVSCPDGSAFIFRAAPGDFAVVSPLLEPDPNKTDAENAAAQTAANQAAQASANDQAQAYAQAQAGFHVLCLTDLPNGCLNTPYSSTVTSSCNLPPVLNFSIVSGSLPNGLTLTQNTDNTAILSGTPTSTGTFTFTIHAQDLNGNIKERTYTISISAITNAPPSANLGSAYTFTFTVVGGTPPYTFFLASGALPAGLTLTSDGTISGTPTSVETQTFVVSFTDSLNNSCTQEFTLAVTSDCPQWGNTVWGVPVISPPANGTLVYSNVADTIIIQEFNDNAPLNGYFISNVVGSLPLYTGPGCNCKVTITGGIVGAGLILDGFEVTQDGVQKAFHNWVLGSNAATINFAIIAGVNSVIKITDINPGGGFIFNANQNGVNTTNIKIVFANV